MPFGFKSALTKSLQRLLKFCALGCCSARGMRRMDPGDRPPSSHMQTDAGPGWVWRAMVTVATIWAMPTGSKLVPGISNFWSRLLRGGQFTALSARTRIPSAVALCAVAYADFLLQGLKARASLDHL